jgi:hypothetical protein
MASMWGGQPSGEFGESIGGQQEERLKMERIKSSRGGIDEVMRVMKKRTYLITWEPDDY